MKQRQKKDGGNVVGPGSGSLHRGQNGIHIHISLSTASETVLAMTLLKMRTID